MKKKTVLCFGISDKFENIVYELTCQEKWRLRIDKEKTAENMKVYKLTSKENETHTAVIELYPKEKYLNIKYDKYSYQICKVEENGICVVFFFGPFKFLNVFSIMPKMTYLPKSLRMNAFFENKDFCYGDLVPINDFFQNSEKSWIHEERLKKLNAFFRGEILESSFSRVIKSF